MFRITVNGQSRAMQSLSIESLLEAENIAREDWGSLAVAQNGRVIPKAAWSDTALSENDRIEIVRAFAGG